MSTDTQQAKIEILNEEITNERGRLSSDRMDISFGELINLYKNKELIIRPEYQRLYRWSDEQKTAFIESILLNIPIPPIFVAEDEDGVWELIDGLQRLSTIISFFGELQEDLTKQVDTLNEEEVDYESLNDNSSDYDDDEYDIIEVNIGNKWVLGEGGLIKSLEGFNIDNMPKKYLINIKRAVCRVEILRGESNISMKYELFKRLNSGGSKLTPQEIRNAIYRGINPQLNKLIEELSQNANFVKLSKLTKKKKQQLYDQELVLRFIAFLNNTSKINDTTENFLNSFMQKSVEEDDFDLEEYKLKFKKTINLIDSLEDTGIFRDKRNIFVPAYFEGIMIGTAQNLDYFSSNTEILKHKISLLKEDEDFKKYSGSASGSKNRNRNRLTRALKIFSDHEND